MLREIDATSLSVVQILCVIAKAGFAVLPVWTLVYVLAAPLHGKEQLYVMQIRLLEVHEFDGYTLPECSDLTARGDPTPAVLSIQTSKPEPPCNLSSIIINGIVNDESLDNRTTVLCWDREEDGSLELDSIPLHDPRNRAGSSSSDDNMFVFGGIAANRCLADANELVYGSPGTIALGVPVGYGMARESSRPGLYLGIGIVTAIAVTFQSVSLNWIFAAISKRIQEKFEQAQKSAKDDRSSRQPDTDYDLCCCASCTGAGIMATIFSTAVTYLAVNLIVSGFLAEELLPGLRSSFLFGGTDPPWPLFICPMYVFAVIVMPLGLMYMDGDKRSSRGNRGPSAPPNCCTRMLVDTFIASGSVALLAGMIAGIVFIAIPTLFPIPSIDEATELLYTKGAMVSSGIATVLAFFVDAAEACFR